MYGNSLIFLTFLGDLLHVHECEPAEKKEKDASKKREEEGKKSTGK